MTTLRAFHIQAVAFRDHDGVDARTILRTDRQVVRDLVRRYVVSGG